jgi:hypothetical protein
VPTPCESRRNLLVDPEVLFDFGYAREKVVNFCFIAQLNG